MITHIGKYKFNKTETTFVNTKLAVAEQNHQIPVSVSNRFTGVTHTMPYLAKTIFDWINNWNDSYERSFRPPFGSSVSEFDMARSLFRKVWPTEYMDLLD